MLAAGEGHVRIIEILLQNKADVNLRDEDGWNAIHFACWVGSVQALIQFEGKQCDWTTIVGEVSALHIAAANGHFEVVEYLLNMSSTFNVNKIDRYGCTILLEATRNGHTEMVKFLLQRGANPLITRAHDKISPAHVAAMDGEEHLLKILYEAGADLFARDSLGFTPELYARRYRLNKIVEMIEKISREKGKLACNPQSLQ